MATDDCTKALSKASDHDLQNLVFDSFHKEGIALVPHEMLRKVALALSNSHVLIKERRALADELAKLAPGVVR